MQHRLENKLVVRRDPSENLHTGIVLCVLRNFEAKVILLPLFFPLLYSFMPVVSVYLLLVQQTGGESKEHREDLAPRGTWTLHFQSVWGLSLETVPFWGHMGSKNIVWET